MKPLTSRQFHLTVIIFSLVVSAALAWWLLFIFQSFREIAVVENPPTSLQINQADYDYVHKQLQGD